VRRNNSHAVKNYLKGMNWKHIPIRYEIHHLLPVKDGGDDKFDNLVCMCSCDHLDVTTVQNMKEPSDYLLKIKEKIENKWIQKKINREIFEDKPDFLTSDQLENFFRDIKMIENLLINGRTGKYIAENFDGL
jgi:hypothetical protein